MQLCKLHISPRQMKEVCDSLEETYLPKHASRNNRLSWIFFKNVRDSRTREKNEQKSTWTYKGEK